MTEKPPRPVAVWIAVLVNCVVGLTVLGFNGIVVYAVTTDEGGGPSVKDVAIIVGFFVITLACFVSAVLAMLRRKIARLVPLISVAILLLLVIDMLLGVNSFDVSGIGAVLVGMFLLLSVLLLFMLTPTVLLSFGKSVNAYFGVSSKDEDQQLLEPPPPPSWFP